MAQAAGPVAISIRPAGPQDADGIAEAFMESAEYHAGLDPRRYAVPAVEIVAERYRRRDQHPDDGESITFVAECSGEIVGFVDVQLQRSPDPMHRQLLYCEISEIAVRSRDQKRGIGGRLLQAAEEWGRLQGADFASLEYNAANTRASSFYQQRMGYSVAHVIAIKRL